MTSFYTVGILSAMESDAEFRSMIYNRNGEYFANERYMHVGDMLVNSGSGGNSYLRFWVGHSGERFPLLVEKMIGNDSIKVTPIRCSLLIDIWGYRVGGQRFLVVRSESGNQIARTTNYIYRICESLNLDYLGFYASPTDSFQFLRDQSRIVKMMGSLNSEEYSKPTREQIMSALPQETETLKDFESWCMHTGEFFECGERLMVWQVIESDIRKQGNTITYGQVFRRFVYMQVFKGNELILDSIIENDSFVEDAWVLHLRDRIYLYLEVSSNAGKRIKSRKIFEMTREKGIQKVAPFYSRDELHRVGLWNGIGSSEAYRDENWVDVEEIPFVRWNQFDPPLVRIPEREYAD